MSYVRTLRHICVDLIFTVSFQDRQHFEFNLFKFLRQKQDFSATEIYQENRNKKVCNSLAPFFSQVLDSKIHFSQLWATGFSTLLSSP